MGTSRASSIADTQSDTEPTLPEEVSFDIIVKGDIITKDGTNYVAGDGKTQTNDLAIARDISTEAEKLTGYEKFLIALDMDGNGTIADPADIALLQEQVIE